MANIYKNEMFALANTGANLLYSVPAYTRAIIKTLQAVNIGANATPIFPQTPFIPNRKPTLPGRFTIIAIPTGW